MVKGLNLHLMYVLLLFLRLFSDFRCLQMSPRIRDALWHVYSNLIYLCLFFYRHIRLQQVRQPTHDQHVEKPFKYVRAAQRTQDSSGVWSLTDCPDLETDVHQPCFSRRS